MFQSSSAKSSATSSNTTNSQVSSSFRSEPVVCGDNCYPPSSQTSSTFKNCIAVYPNICDNPELFQSSSSASTNSVASSSDQITSLCIAIYPSPCDSSSVPTCQEMGLSICNNSSVTVIKEGQTSQVTQTTSNSIVSATNAVNSAQAVSQVSSQVVTNSTSSNISSNQNSSVDNNSYLTASTVSDPKTSSLISLNSSKSSVSSQIALVTSPSIPNNGDGNYDGIDDSKQPKVKTILINNKPVTIVLKNSDCKELDYLQNLSGMNKEWVEFRAKCGKTEIETIWHGFDTKLRYKLVKYNPITKTSKKWNAKIQVLGNKMVTTHTISDGQDGDWNNVKTEIWDPYTLEEDNSVSSILNMITPRSGGEIIYLPLFIITIIGGIYVFSKNKSLDKKIKL